MYTNKLINIYTYIYIYYIFIHIYLHIDIYVQILLRYIYIYTDMVICSYNLNWKHEPFERTATRSVTAIWFFFSRIGEPEQFVRACTHTLPLTPKRGSAGRVNTYRPWQFFLLVYVWQVQKSTGKQPQNMFVTRKHTTQRRTKQSLIYFRQVCFLFSSFVVGTRISLPAVPHKAVAEVSQ